MYIILDMSQTNIIDLIFGVGLTINLNYKYDIQFLELDNIFIYLMRQVVRFWINIYSIHSK